MRVLRPSIRSLNPSKTRQGGSAHMRASASVRTRRRLQLWTRNPHCAHCGVLVDYPFGFELDHIVPLSQGGTDTEQNSQVLCIDCHKAKSSAERAGRPWGTGQTGSAGGR